MENATQQQVGGSHYRKMAIQPIEFIEGNKLTFSEGNAIKYICRHRSKGGAKDLLKAKHYIDLILHREYGEKNDNVNDDTR